MENVEELRREAEEVKERLRRDILELRDILKRATEGIGVTSQLEAKEAVRKAERRIEETVSHIEKRFEKAIGLVEGCCLNDGNIVTRKFNHTDFTNVEVDCAFRVDIIRADKYQVAIRADTTLNDYINVIKSGNTLKMSLKPHRFESRPSIEATIALPHLNKIRLGAATRGTVRGFNSAEDLDIRLSGSSSLETDVSSGTMRCEISGASRLIGKMKAGDAEFILSGASLTELSGSAKNVVLNAWGASQVEMEGFKLQDMTVHLNGASEATINVTGKLDIDLNSGSRLTYVDNPTIQNISVTGASSLHHK